MKVIALLFTLSKFLLIGKGHFMHKMCITKYISKKKQKQKNPKPPTLHYNATLKHLLCQRLLHMSCLPKNTCESGEKRGRKKIQVSVYVSNFSDRVIFSHLMSDSVLSFENEVVTTGVPLLAK